MLLSVPVLITASLQLTCPSWKYFVHGQEAALCGVHCLNTLLQGPYFSELDLGQISQELDAKEREMMAAGGTEGEEYKRFLAEGSHNAAADGMFSIQVYH